MSSFNFLELIRSGAVPQRVDSVKRIINISWKLSWVVCNSVTTLVTGGLIVTRILGNRVVAVMFMIYSGILKQLAGYCPGNWKLLLKAGDLEHQVSINWYYCRREITITICHEGLIYSL